ncbi:MAG: carboxynorspermidine decarboxylase [Campylobacterales bacterium]
MIENIQTPCYVLEVEKLEKNLKLFEHIKSKIDIKILLALKGYALWDSFPLIAKYLDGITASGLYEARLGAEEFKKEVHTYSPGFKEQDIDEIVGYSNHIVFNSISQLKKFAPKIESAKKNVSLGLRVNPEYSEVTPPIYNPCVINSRLGVIKSEFDESVLPLIEGLHFHTHCEQNSDALARTLPHFEERFGIYLPSMKWVNFGGGHHITRADYDVELFIRTIEEFQARYPHLQVYIEPGEAIGWECGFLVGEVLDIVKNGMEIAILDVSAATHMPDTLEMPYRPLVRGSDEAGVEKHTYRLAGPTCLAGDVIGDYSFKQRLKVGDKIIFEDMIHYTMVKNNTFNGVPLPSIAKIDREGVFQIVKEFGYFDYKNRLS